jgi:hypothetical protein
MPARVILPGRIHRGVFCPFLNTQFLRSFFKVEAALSFYLSFLAKLFYLRAFFISSLKRNTPSRCYS